MSSYNKTSIQNIGKQRFKCVVTDWITTFIAFFLFDIFRFYYMKLGTDYFTLANYLLSSKLVMEQVFVPILLLFVYWLSGYYNRPFNRSRLNEFLLTFYSQIFNSLLIYLAALTNDQLYLRRENWMLLLILFLLLFVFTYLGRLLVTDSMIHSVKKNNIRLRTAIIGLSDEATDVAQKLSGSSGFPSSEIVAFLPFGNEQYFPEKNRFENAVLLNEVDELKALCSDKKIDQIIIVPPQGKSPSKKILYLLYHLYPYDVSIKINPDTLALITPTIKLEDILGEPLIDLTRPQISEYSKNIKRFMDVIICSVGMMLMSPVFVIAAIGVSLSGKGKIIYSQERMGLHRKPFKIYKFRSMVEGAEKDGIPQLSSDADRRITNWGRWMRKYRIDELPQFWNVIKGDMSLVGPRPEREYFIDKIVKKAPWYTLVLQVKPGITSWGMVKYGYATDTDQMIERNRFDLIYLANMSVAVDFKILLHTLKTVSSGEGK